MVLGYIVFVLRQPTRHSGVFSAAADDGNLMGRSITLVGDHIGGRRRVDST